MRHNDLKVRTRDFALLIIRFYVSLPKTTEAQILGKQMLRSGTSVGAQYRESQRAKSNANLVSKIEGSLQELEETMYWCELLSGAAIVESNKIQPLLDEAEELMAILVTIVRKVKNQ